MNNESNNKECTSCMVTPDECSTCVVPDSNTQEYDSDNNGVNEVKSDIVLYSTGCPKCKVLKAKLDQKDVNYDIETDIEKMQEMQITSVPVLKVKDKILQFKEAVDWVNSLVVEVTD